jgi:vancomycin resistance protein YoaR
MDATPTRLSAAIFAAKTAILRAKRSMDDLAHPVPLLECVPHTTLPLTAAQSITPLWTDSSPAEQWYQRGKVENLRIASASLNGLILPAGRIFSFWRQVGKATARKGYRAGRMLQEGCMIPAIAGGLCQLSNALYQVALDSGCEIVERHRHSRTVPGSATAAGRDATVAWNYVDLRFRSIVDMQFTIEVTPDHLIVALHSSIPTPVPMTSPLPAHESLPGRPIGNDHACDTCGSSECFRKRSPRG